MDVILTTHNNLELTIECLKALYSFTTAPFNLVIIDDSTDLTPQYLEQFAKEHGNVKIVYPGEKWTGGNTGWRIGLENSSDPIVVTMTNSSRVEPGWHIGPLQMLEQNPKVGLIGIKLLYPTGMIWHAGIQFANHIPIHIGINEAAHRYSYAVPVPCVNHSVGFFRREALDKSLDEETYLGWKGFEDTDINLTIRENGWHIWYCGEASAYHIESPTRIRGKDFWQEYNENLRRFIMKWHGKDHLFNGA
ncbi:MAG: glycosyltransferase family 2 protein [Candidatus Odinarchaeota archaeon]